MTITTDPPSASSGAASDSTDDRMHVTQETGRDLPGRVLTALLYMIGIPTFLAGIAGMQQAPGFALGLMASACIILPPTRQVASRVIRLRISPEVRFILFILTPPITAGLYALTPISEELEKAAADRRTFIANVAAEKPQILSKIKAHIKARNFNDAIAVAERYAAAGDPDIKKLGDDARRYRDAAKRAAEAQAAAKAEEQERAACEASESCIISTHKTDARQQCKPAIEAYARFDYDWTDGFGGPETFFSSYVDRSAGTIRFAGNQIKLQNGFGVWQQYRYECLFNYRAGRVVSVTLNP